jgi:hypothetical protein
MAKGAARAPKRTAALGGMHGIDSFIGVGKRIALHWRNIFDRWHHYFGVRIASL